VTVPLIDVYKLHWPDLLPYLDALTTVLSTDERERTSRFHFDQDRKRFILCRAWLRCILGELLEIPPQAVAFRLGSHGKPAVDGPWEFNLSHSGMWALCAAVRGLPVGADIEVLRELADAADLAKRFFAPTEARMVHASNPRAHAFFTVWTRKEAFVKAVGTGFYTDPGEFVAALNAPFIGDDRGLRWGIRNLPIIPHHAAALCALGEWKWREAMLSSELSIEAA
jgi:4'-phosphopantetheinyl transferase